MKSIDWALRYKLRDDLSNVLLKKLPWGFCCMEGPKLWRDMYQQLNFIGARIRESIKGRISNGH